MNKDFRLEAKLISKKMKRSAGKSIYDDDLIFQLSSIEIIDSELYLILDVLEFDNWSLFTTERIIVKRNNKKEEYFLKNIKKIDIYYNSIRIKIKYQITRKEIVVNAMSIFSIYKSLDFIYNFFGKSKTVNFSTFPGHYTHHTPSKTTTKRFQSWSIEVIKGFIRDAVKWHFFFCFKNKNMK